MNRNSKIILLLIAIALVPVIVKLQATIDPQRGQFQPGKGIGSVMSKVGNNPVVLPSQFIAGTLIGFREVIAGLLWVRTDEFFHSGNFDAITPMIRMITWLDPHQVDVYSTGAWHLSYNFTDSAERADRRYLAPAIKFMEEGIENNPEVWDIKLGLGFMIHALKTLDFKETIRWELEASKSKDAKLYVHRQLAHAYTKDGNIDAAIRQWSKCVNQSKELLKLDPDDREYFTHHEVSVKNLDELLIRKANRASLPNRQTKIFLEAKIRKIGPKELVVIGRTNLPDGARIDFTLADTDFLDYNQRKMEQFTWDVDPDETACYDVGMHGILVTKGKFQSKYNFSKDPRMYAFKKEKYVITISFNPRTANSAVQDIVGWSGEGISGDSKYLDTSIPGLRRLRKVITMNRNEII
ncbi:MAG: tetratricopeptide repeat protein [Armatimonadota bacterium]